MITNANIQVMGINVEVHFENLYFGKEQLKLHALHNLEGLA